MPIGQSRVILCLTPGSLDAALVSGRRVLRMRRTRLNPEDWAEAWADRLLMYDRALITLLGHVCPGRKPLVTVLYQGPDSITEVCSVPGTGDAAVRAARLALVESFPSIAQRIQVAAAVIATESEGKERQSHVLTAADQDEAAHAVFGWVTRAGGRFDRMVPSKAVTLETILGRVTGAEADPRTAVCYIGETTTAIACAGATKVAFVRAVDFGFSQLGDAFARVADIDEDADEAGRSRGAGDALEQLFSVGVPFDPKDEAPGGRLARRVLPLLQPTLQRYCIETKQTLRFGVPADQEPPTCVLLTGPGASIPGLARTMSESLDLPVEVCESSKRTSPVDAVEWSSPIRGYLERPAGGLAIRPRVAIEQMHSRALGQRLRVGAGLALVLIGGEIAGTALKKSDVDRGLHANRPALREIEVHREMSERAGALADELQLAIDLTDRVLGERPDWYTVLAELSDLAGDPRLLTEIRAHRDNKGVNITVFGVAPEQSEAATPGGYLGSLIEDLTESPVTALVQIGSARRSTLGGLPAKSFSLRITLRTLSAHELQSELVSAEEAP